MSRAKKWPFKQPPHASFPLAHAAWCDRDTRLHVYKTLLQHSGCDDPFASGVAGYVWRLEQETMACSRGQRNSYMQRCVVLLHLLDMHPLEHWMQQYDATALAWLEERQLLPNCYTEEVRARCSAKYDTADALQHVKLEIPEGVTGGARCRKCHSHDLCVVTRQTRGGDEGMTAFTTCNECGHRQ